MMFTGDTRVEKRWLAIWRVLPVLVFMAVPLSASLHGDEADAVASSSATCPAGVGAGGQPAVSLASAGGGDGCVVFEFAEQYVTFTHTGSSQTWTVPNGVNSVVVHAVGAGGGGGRSGQSTQGGGGGYATGRLTVAPGQQLEVIVGGGGRRHCAADVPPRSNETGRRNFSFGGGAVGNGTTNYDCSFASGGGRSAVRVLGATEDVITAGGGGGGGYDTAGGGGGGTVGGDGVGGRGGKGGTQSAGGASVGPEIGAAGIRYAGGWGGLSNTDDNAASEAGGGGGGYHGGGAGGDNGGGGGGSSYLGTLADASTVAATGATAGIAIPTNTAPPGIPTTIGLGSSVTGTPGGWVHAASASYQWQFSADGVTYSDIANETGLTFTPTQPGFVRLVERRSNFLGQVAANSVAATVPDTRLATLEASAGTLSPAFSSARMAYSLAVGYRTRTLRLSATPSDGSATVSVAGASPVAGSQQRDIDLSVGANSIVVRVAKSGVNSDTTIVVTRAAAVAPAAPTITNIAVGNGALTVAFDGSIDDGGEPVDHYEYSVDGSTWVDVGGGASPFTISGLTNGTTYSVSMRAVSVVGTGAASAATSATPTRPVESTMSSTTTSSTTSTTSTTVAQATTPTTPSVTTTTMAEPTTTSVTTIAALATTAERSQKAPRVITTTTAQPTTTTVTPTTTSSPVDTPPEMTTTTLGEVAPAVAAAGTEGPPAAPLTTAPAVQEVSDGVRFELTPEFGVGDPAAGARVRATAMGLLPSTAVRLEVRSEPTLLAEGVTGAAGDAVLEGVLPAGLSAGTHMLSLSGTGPAGQPLVSVVALDVDESGVLASVTKPSGTLSKLPDSSQVERMVAARSAPYDASRDAAGVVALAGAAVVLLGLAGAGGSQSGNRASSGAADNEGGDGDNASSGAKRDESAEGSLASAEAKALDLSVQGEAAWGDRSLLWTLPGWRRLQSLLQWCVTRVQTKSTLLLRVLQDGTWCRAAFGTASVLPWVAGAVVGAVAASSVDGFVVPPAFGFVVAIVVVSFIDSLAGLVAWLAFTVTVVARSGFGSWFDVRTLLGLGVLFVALPMIAASFRPLLRPLIHSVSATRGTQLERAFDYLAVPLFLSFAAASVYRALNGLSGLDVASDADANVLRWVCLGVVAVRMALEDATLRWFPARRQVVALVADRGTSRGVAYVNVALALGIYVLTAGPYMGMGPRTWLIMSMMCIVPLVKIHKDKLPNATFVHRWLPRGILRSVIMLYAMAYYGRCVLDVTGRDARQAVPLMLLPAIARGLADCFGRSGGSWPERRVKTLAGLALWAVSFSVVAGWLTP